jgi:hypothetical protein
MKTDEYAIVYFGCFLRVQSCGSCSLMISYLLAAEIETALGHRVDKLAGYTGHSTLNESDMKTFDISLRRKSCHDPLRRVAAADVSEKQYDPVCMSVCSCWRG